MPTGAPGRDHRLEEARRLLAVGPLASPEELRRAYHAAVRRWHPDLHAHDPAEQRLAEEHTKDLNHAYQLLMEEAARRGREPDPRPPVCPLHAADQVYRCPRCGRPSCVQCLTRVGCVRCPPPMRRRTRQRVGPMSLWGPVALLAGMAWALNFPVAVFLWSLWGYLALVGISGLGRLGIAGLPLWLVFPASLPVAGGYELVTAVFRDSH